MPTKRVTLADVAAEVGLSMTTVSMILNNRPGTRLSAETAQRVREVAEALNYRPNPAARTLRMGKTRAVGFVSDDVTVTRYASAMIRGLLDVADEHDHTVLIAETGHSRSRLRGALDAMLDRRPDAMIFGLMGAREIDLPELPADLPVVMLNGTASRPMPAVLPDEYTAGSAIAQVLVDAGHREIGLIGRFRPEWLVPEVTVTIGSRFAGIDRVLEAAGVRVVAVGYHRFWEPEGGYEDTRRFLADGRRFTALLCLNDNLAFGAYQALQEAGLRVPEDVSVVSFDDDVIASYVRPQLTTARIPYEQMGAKAMELALSEDRPLGPHLVPMPLQVRRSVRQPAV